MRAKIRIGAAGTVSKREKILFPGGVVTTGGPCCCRGRRAAAGMFCFGNLMREKRRGGSVSSETVQNGLD